MKSQSVTWERGYLAGCPASLSKFGFDVRQDAIYSEISNMIKTFLLCENDPPKKEQLLELITDVKLSKKLKLLG